MSLTKSSLIFNQTGLTNIGFSMKQNLKYLIKKISPTNERSSLSPVSENYHLKFAIEEFDSFSSISPITEPDDLLLDIYIPQYEFKIKGIDWVTLLGASIEYLDYRYIFEDFHLRIIHGARTSSVNDFPIDIFVQEKTQRSKHFCHDAVLNYA